jgi:hypothetical protein
MPNQWWRLCEWLWVWLVLLDGWHAVTTSAQAAAITAVSTAARVRRLVGMV